MFLTKICARGAVLGLVALASACTNLTTSESDSTPTGKPPEQTVVTPAAKVPVPLHRPTTPSASAAWKPLLAQAEQASGRGDYEQALALLERAQRIDPDSAAVYLSLAKTHRARGDTGQASAVAERGLLYCSTDTECNALRAYTR